MIYNRLTRWLAIRLLVCCVTILRWLKRGPDVEIERTDSGGVYLQRWWLIPRNRFFNVYLHNYLRDDIGPELHDHPWWSVSLCLDGWLREIYLDPRDAREHVRDIYAGAVIARSARFAHRLLVPERRTASGETMRGAMTLFITGPRVRTWGFLCPKTVAGWVPWRKYLSKDANGALHGCGET